MARNRSTFERNLDWNLLKTFHEIVRSGGVSKAADRLARQQPAVSSSLKRLEDYLGTTLCRRGPGGFELTSGGEALARKCERIFETICEVADDICDDGDLGGREVRITMIGNLANQVLDKTIADFGRHYRQGPIVISTVLITDVEGIVVRQECDIGVAPIPPTNPSLRYEFIYREQFRPFCGRSHPLYGKTIREPRELAEQAFVLPDVEEAWVFRRYRERYGWGRNFVAKSTQFNEVRRMVAQGMGVAFMPQEMLEADIQAGVLWPLMPPQPDAAADVMLISDPSGPGAAAVRLFTELLRANRDLELGESLAVQATA